MAIHKFIPAGGAGTVIVDGSTLSFLGQVSLEAPKAAALLRTVPEEQQLSVVEELLEHGAAAAAAVQSSAHIVLMESKVEELARRLNDALDEQLTTAGENSAEVTERLLTAHREALVKLLTPLMDPNAQNGLPVLMTQLLQKAHRDSMRHIEVMLQDGEDGALGRAVKKITDEMKATGTAITKSLGEREALRTKSNRRGGCFEDILAARLPILTRGMGRVDHCAKSEGQKAANSGDYVLTIDTGIRGQAVTVAIEAKSHKNRLSANAIRAELKRARQNRGASAAILIADSADVLPDGLGFAQVSDTDFCVALVPEDGDETPLACALHMARAIAMASIEAAGDSVDLTAAHREVAGLRTLLEQFSRMELCHSRIDKEVTSARGLADDLKVDMLSALRRLDSILDAQ